MRRLRFRLLGTGGCLALALTGVFAGPDAAEAFDPNIFSGNGFTSCLYEPNPGDPTWAAGARANLVWVDSRWESSVTGLTINHYDHWATCTDGQVSCDQNEKVQQGWIDYLDGGAIASTHGLNCADEIWYAMNGSDGQLIQWLWSGTPSTGSREVDFRTAALHEFGHALGLNHPEIDASYPWKSWYGSGPTVMGPGEATWDVNRYVWADDRSGGRWIINNTVIPNSSAQHGTTFWTVTDGLLVDQGNYFQLTTLGGEDRSNMAYKIRMSTRQTWLTFSVTFDFGYWGQGGIVRPGVRHRFIRSDGSPGDWVWTWGDSCTDTDPTNDWQTCTSTFYVEALDDPPDSSETIAAARALLDRATGSLDHEQRTELYAELEGLVDALSSDLAVAQIEMGESPPG